MSTQKPFTYQPEDLERLLRTKEFIGLLPEERDFVLQHVSNEKEFNELKMLLGNIESSEHEMQDPPASVWKNVKREFNEQKTPRFKVWLNILFPPLPEWSAFRKTSYSLAGLAAVVGAVIWFVPRDNHFMAANQSNVQSAEEKSTNSSPDSISENGEFKINSEQYAELQPVSGIYVTPVVQEVEHIHETVTSDEVREEANSYPMNDGVQEKSERTYDAVSPAESDNIQITPTSTVTFTSSPASNPTVPEAEWKIDEKANTLVPDSTQIKDKKKKKTPPKKK